MVSGTCLRGRPSLLNNISGFLVSFLKFFKKGCSIRHESFGVSGLLGAWSLVIFRLCHNLIDLSKRSCMMRFGKLKMMAMKCSYWRIFSGDIQGRPSKWVRVRAG